MTLVRRLNPVELPKLIELSTNVVDTNTSFTIFEIRVNIFQSIAIKSICREFCYYSVMRDAIKSI